MSRCRDHLPLLVLPLVATAALTGAAASRVPLSPVAAPAAASVDVSPTTAAPRRVVAPVPAPALAATAVAALPAAAAAVTGLTCRTLDRLPVCTHGDDTAVGPRTVNGESGAAPAPMSATRVGCYGDGTSGNRITAVYLRPIGSADRYADYADRFRGWAGALEKAFDDSAHQTRGARHIRFTSSAGAGCTLSILRLTLPSSAFASFTSTIQALQQRGFDRAGSKYLLWTDASTYCGIASMYDDDTPGQDNLNNGSLPTYARVDRSCWGYAEAHEVMHMLGGVSARAPHGTAGFHCNDGVEVMCYDDGSARATQHRVCGSEHARLFDCHSDDYFSTAPAAGSWLAGHWNVAFSSFLSPAWSEPAPTPPAPEEETSSDPAADPAPTPLVSLPPLLGIRR